MKVRIDAIPMAGQWWQDTLDYHVRPALEKIGEKIDGWTHEDEHVVSPDVGAARAERIREALADLVLVKVTLQDA